MEGTIGGPAPKQISDLDLRILELIGPDACESLSFKQNHQLSSVIPSTSTNSDACQSDCKISDASHFLERLINPSDMSMDEDEKSDLSQMGSDYKPDKNASKVGGNRDVLRRKRNRGMVTSPERNTQSNVQSLIAAQVETHKALNVIAVQLKEANNIAKERNSIELRKAVAFEKYVEALSKNK